MRIHHIFSLVTLCFLAFSEVGYAQKCGGAGYSLSDKSIVFSVIKGRVVTLLERMHQLSVASAAHQFSPQTTKAINDEYQDLILELSNLSDTDSPKLRRRTVDWLNRVTDTNFLGLAGTKLLATDLQNSNENSAIAAQRIYEATLRFWNCL